MILADTECWRKSEIGKLVGLTYFLYELFDHFRIIDTLTKEEVYDSTASVFCLEGVLQFKNLEDVISEVDR